MTEKGELIENLIREKPLGTGFQQQNNLGSSSSSSVQPKLEGLASKIFIFLNTENYSSVIPKTAQYTWPRFPRFRCP